MRVLVVGAGSLGSLVGGLLAREHEVTLVGRQSHVRAVRDDGLRITGEIDRTVHPDAVTAVGAATSPDLAVVTVKSFDTATAADELARVDPGTTLSLQNGLGNESILADRVSGPVLAGTTTYGALLRTPGTVACTGVGSVTLGPHRGVSVGPAEHVGEAFRRADIETTVVSDPRPHLWEKLAVNAGINPVTALARVRNGALVDGAASGIAVTAAEETAAVAREHGIDLSGERAGNAVREVATATAQNRSSMLADVAAGRRTEIDAINGVVLDRAEQPVPVNRTLTAVIRAWETDEGVR